jgi:predicted DNA-binding protein
MEVKEMPTQNPRINVVLEPGLYNMLSKLAKKTGVSLSLLSRDLIKDSLEVREDQYWQEVAQQREETFAKKKALSHRDVWK